MNKHVTRITAALALSAVLTVSGVTALGATERASAAQPTGFIVGPAPAGQTLLGDGSVRF